MTFLWPELLWLLAAVPLAVAGYVWLLRRRKRAVARYANLNMVREALGSGPRLRRHVPPALFLVALALMLFAIARPAAIVMLPSQQETLILAMDVSGSMRAKDVEPTRLAAAQAAAKSFVESLPRTVRVGVVSFAGTAAVVQQPTHSREDVIAAIDRFQLQRGTAIGSGIIMSLATIFPDAGISVSELIYGRNAPRPVPLPADPRREKKEFKPVPPGSHAGAAIILLTDGQRTAGPDSMEAAKMAARRGRAEGDREPYARRVLPRRECGRPEEGLRAAQREDRLREERDGNHRLLLGGGRRDRARRRGAVDALVQPDSLGFVAE
jgi:Ca-activated chloride channel family protein